MKKSFLKNIIKESITDYLSALNETTEEVTPMQQYLMDYESEISNSPEQYFDDIKKLNSIQDVIGYYGGKRQWAADKDLKQELSNLIKTLKSKFSVNEGSSVPEDSTDMALDMINKTPTQTTSGKPLREEPSTPFEDKVTKDQHIYLVKKAMNESTEKDLVEKKLLLDLIGEGLYEGAYLNEAAAINSAKKTLKGRDILMKENVKKGNSKITDLVKQIENLKIDIKAKQSKAIDEPGMRDSLIADVDSLMSQLDKKEAMLNKLKAALEKSAPKKEKKEKKDDE